MANRRSWFRFKRFMEQYMRRCTVRIRVTYTDPTRLRQQSPIGVGVIPADDLNPGTLLIGRSILRLSLEPLLISRLPFLGVVPADDPNPGTGRSILRLSLEPLLISRLPFLDRCQSILGMVTVPIP